VSAAEAVATPRLNRPAVRRARTSFFICLDLG